ncbi:MAG: DUF4292 domain-containing protein [Deltaproteobacteria bacterium]|nr:DUF4292 domain-containing protein [Deltaproteobacteria bacterium]MBW2137428.1 DUF4292 domain-containing protein [Deltaproteobacteria bacterium]
MFDLHFRNVVYHCRPLGLRFSLKRYLIAVPFVVSLLGCGPIVSRPAIERSLEREKVHAVLEHIKEQDRKVSSFFSSGKISADAWYGRDEADILVIGRRYPLKIKVEITHSWGQPILHLLLAESRIQVLSFRDRRFYSGPGGAEALQRFFQIHVRPEIFWSVLRAYPTLQEHSSITMGPNQISLHDQEDMEVERIYLHPEALLPRSISYRGEDLAISFDNFQGTNRFSYAGEVVLEDRRKKKKLVIRNEKMVFNRDIPPEVFAMHIPPGFEVYNLDDQDDRD